MTNINKQMLIFFVAGVAASAQVNAMNGQSEFVGLFNEPNTSKHIHQMNIHQVQPIKITQQTTQKKAKKNKKKRHEFSESHNLPQIQPLPPIGSVAKVQTIQPIVSVSQVQLPQPIVPVQQLHSIQPAKPQQKPVEKPKFDPMQQKRPWVNKSGRLMFPDGVVDISGNEFSGNTQLKEIIIPDSIKRIGDSSFANCTNVTSIQLGTNLREIDDNAFAGITKLSNLMIPASVTRIGKGALTDMRLYSLLFCDPDNCSVEANDSYTALYTNYKMKKSNDIKQKVLADMPLVKPTVLKELEIPNDIDKISSHSYKWNTSEKVIVPSRITSIEDSSFFECRNLKEISIFSKNIGCMVFCDCPQVTRIDIQEGVKSIGDKSFILDKSYSESNYGPKDLILPDSLVSIGYGCFAHLNNIHNVSVGTNLTNIGEKLFYGNNNYRITVRGNGDGKNEVKRLLSLSGIPLYKIND